MGAPDPQVARTSRVVPFLRAGCEGCGSKADIGDAGHAQVVADLRVALSPRGGSVQNGRRAAWIPLIAAAGGRTA